VSRVAAEPFVFTACVELRQALDLHAHDARELKEKLEGAPDDSVFFHVHGYFLRHRPFTTAYGNDFARWIAVELGEMALAERLAVVDPFKFDSLTELREELVTIIHGQLRDGGPIQRVEFEHAFHFQQSRIVPVPLGPRVTTLAEFRQGLAGADASAIHHHMVEARARFGRRGGDFAEWLRGPLELPALAEEVEHIDLYLTTPERVRSRLLALVDHVLESGDGGGEGR
jgi:Family of unknown function (DUF5752)